MVNIDTVYQRVLALANKEQRGYITPQEFNLFANQAQMDIFEQYFYDLNQFKRIPGNTTIYADMVDIIQEKITFLEAAVGSNTIISWGMDGDYIVIPDEVYRLSQVRVSGFPVEILPTKEFNMVRESPLTAPPVNRPIARRDIRGILIRDKNGTVTPSTHSINASYIKRPTTVQWNGYNTPSTQLYNEAESINFELHPSEEPNLVLNILKLAGVAMKDPSLYQLGAAEEAKDIQQEKQ